VEERKSLAWGRWFSSVIISVALAVIIATYTNRDNLIADCHRSNATRQEIIDFLELAKLSQETDAESADNEKDRVINTTAATKYGEQQVRIRALIKPCNEAYPAPIPWTVIE
jgi:hypothetical protein